MNDSLHNLPHDNPLHNVTHDVHDVVERLTPVQAAAFCMAGALLLSPIPAVHARDNS
jgi:hypothetical protein